MKWKKGQVNDNASKTLPLWSSPPYYICQNINGGRPPDKYKGVVDKYGHCWLFEVTKTKDKGGGEESLGVAPTLISAKAVAEADEDGF